MAKVDLDTYQGYDAILSFAPKSRLNVRRVGLLHRYDFIFYTALVLALKTHISKSRLPADKVFSYRTEGTTPSELYKSVSSWKDFRKTVENRATDADCVVGVTDIADFYPRIYHHRLVNALEASSDKTTKDYIRVLEKMLTRFSGGTSYGIPVGPPASRLLGDFNSATPWRSSALRPASSDKLPRGAPPLRVWFMQGWAFLILHP